MSRSGQIIAIVAISLAFCVTALAGASDAGISIGLRTQDWPFMWKAGRTRAEEHGIGPTEKLRWAIADATLDRYQALGAQWNMVILRQGIDGPDNFARAKAAVAAYERRGIQVVFRLLAAPDTFVNLSGKQLAGQGYNAAYYRWIREIASTFKNDVRYYLIGNELDHGLGPDLLKAQRPHGGAIAISYSQYLKLLATANQAIKNVDPNLDVVDYGVSGFSLGAAVAASLVKSGHLLEAYNYWQAFNYGRAGRGDLRSLLSVLARPETQRRIEFVRKTFLEPGDCDYLQFHYYGGADALPETISWMKQMMRRGGEVRPLFAGEIGFLVPGRKPFGQALNESTALQDDQAMTMVKDFAAILGSGVDNALYWYSRNWVDDGNVAPLFGVSRSADGFLPYAAADAYRVLAHALNGLHAAPRLIPSDPRVTTYHFNGSRDISIVWANTDSVSVNLHRYPPMASVTSMYGRRVVVPEDGLVQLTGQPIYIEWAHKQ